MEKHPFFFLLGTNLRIHPVTLVALCVSTASTVSVLIDSFLDGMSRLSHGGNSPQVLDASHFDLRCLVCLFLLRGKLQELEQVCSSLKPQVFVGKYCVGNWAATVFLASCSKRKTGSQGRESEIITHSYTQ